jgi:hypothetical protein
VTWRKQKKAFLKVLSQLCANSPCLEDKLIVPGENLIPITFKVNIQSSLNQRQSFQNAINSHDS